jgi:3-oxoacyl-[acyl-carrier protein] reductase
MDLQLRDRIALVTGGSRGIARAIAFSLAEAGCAVAICARTAEDVDAAVAQLRALGVPVFATTTDVTEPGAVEHFVAASASALGGVDLLVANVGATVGGRLRESTPEDWTATFELNVLHAARAIRACAPHMQERGGGAAVIVSSITGWKPAPKAQYGAAKAAEIYLASALARELAAERIRINSVSPGSILFPGGGWDAYRQRDPEGFDAFERREFPAGRLGTPEEVADVVTFLLSPRARWINGTNICVDGAQERPSAATW